MVAPGSRWSRMEDAREADYRAFWAGSTVSGFGGAPDSKHALMGTSADGPLTLLLPEVNAGAAVLLCEHRCGK